MAITKEKKKDIVASLEDFVTNAKSLVFVNFHGLSVKNAEDIRRKLREDKVGFYVARKTLINRAIAGKGFSGNIPELPGELALAYGEDSLSPARLIFDFQKKFEGKVSIMGGVFDGMFKSKEEMTAIANIPPLNVLRGMFVNIINSPIQRFAIALDKIAAKKE